MPDALVSVERLREGLRQLSRRQRQYGAPNSEQIDKTCALTIGDLDTIADLLTPSTGGEGARSFVAQTMYQAALSDDGRKHDIPWDGTTGSRDRWLAAADAVLAALTPSGVEGETVPADGVGWVAFNPDTGEEYSPNHPVESGECVEATNIRRSTAQEDALWAGMQAQFQRAEALTQPSTTGETVPGDEVASDTRDGDLAFGRAYFERGFIAAYAWAATKLPSTQLSDAVIDHAWDHRDEGMDEEDLLPLTASPKQAPVTPE